MNVRGPPRPRSAASGCPYRTRRLRRAAAAACARPRPISCRVSTNWPGRRLAACTPPKLAGCWPPSRRSTRSQGASTWTVLVVGLAAASVCDRAADRVRRLTAGPVIAANSRRRPAAPASACSRRCAPSDPCPQLKSPTTPALSTPGAGRCRLVGENREPWPWRWPGAACGGSSGVSPDRVHLVPLPTSGGTSSHSTVLPEAVMARSRRPG